MPTIKNCAQAANVKDPTGFCQTAWGEEWVCHSDYHPIENTIRAQLFGKIVADTTGKLITSQIINQSIALNESVMAGQCQGLIYEKLVSKKGLSWNEPVNRLTKGGVVMHRPMMKKG